MGEKKREPRSRNLAGYNPGAPIQKAKGESWKANAALKDYYLMGPARSLRKLLEIYKTQAGDGGTIKPGDREAPPTTSFNMLGAWSRRNKWQERVNDQLAIDTNEDLAKWQQRRDEIREADYLTGKKIRELALEILSASPEYIMTKELKNNKGDVVTIIKAIDGHLMLKAFDLASELQRIAAELSTENIDVKANGQSLTTIADKLRADLVDRITRELESVNSSVPAKDS